MFGYDIFMENSLNNPLANLMRPQNLEDFVGQEKVVGKDSFLYKAIKNDAVSSLIFWGPPGVGKTTLASIIAKQTKSEFVELSAVTSGIKDLRLVIERAGQASRLAKKTILFIDEIHRWNKAQQDALLPYVESGLLTLIGATTENPSFTVNSALISRSKVIVLEQLSFENLKAILKRALKHYQSQKIKIKASALDLIATYASGDARSALNILESAAADGREINEKLVKEIIAKPNLFYDKNGEEHYNIISALHKSMRGGDADAAVYWTVRMLEAGEDPLYIARRMVRFASEDIGLANNSALLLANSVFEACHKLGMPECGVHLSHLAIYLAKSNKDITAYTAYNKAVAEVRSSGNLPVPLHLRNAPTKLMKDLNYGKDYKYTPLEDSSNQQYLPDKLKNKKFV
jgi:putative ATPase